jgi:hypothetical protein
MIEISGPGITIIVKNAETKSCFVTLIISMGPLAKVSCVRFGSARTLRPSFYYLAMAAQTAVHCESFSIFIYQEVAGNLADGAKDAYAWIKEEPTTDK